MSKILVVSPTPTHATWAGNRARILCMMEMFRELGHEVHFLHLARDPADNDAMRDYWGDRFYSVKYKWPKRPPDQRVIFGTPDDERPAFFSVSPKDEARGLNRADVVMAIQSREQEYLETIVSTRVITVGHVVSVRPPQQAAKAQNILFGGSPNSVNVNAAEFFLTDVLPTVREQCPEARLLVAGRVCEKIADAEGCTKLGELDDLAEAYEAADIIINPRKFGTGLSIKSVEALSYGKPLVATPAGCTGMEDGAGTAFKLAENAAAFAEAVIELLSDPNRYREFAQAGHEYAVRYNAKTTAELKELLQQHDEHGAPE